MALISTLAPSNSSYKKMTQEIDDLAGTRKFDDGPCHHNSDGMACLLWSSKDRTKHATLVFNKPEIGQMYANNIDGLSNDKLIRDAFDRSYSPSDEWDEEFADRAGILGSAVCFDITHHPASEYDYDPGLALKSNARLQEAMRNSTSVKTNLAVYITASLLRCFTN